MRALILIAILLGGMNVARAADEPKPKSGGDALPKAAETAQTFGAKILILTVKSTPYGLYLTKASVRKMGAREFLVGQTINIPGTPRYPTMTMWTPISEINLVMEFDTLEQAAEAIRLQEEAEAEKKRQEAESYKTR